jgi:hypothetical protein
MRSMAAFVRTSLLVAAFAGGGAVLGSGLAPKAAQAATTSAEAATYKCTGMYTCGAGEATCCSGGNPADGTICTTNCPIIIIGGGS